MKDFFISYNKADKAWAEWIAWVLEEAGYSVVIQAWDFRPGENFVLEMQEATRSTNKTVIVLSDSYINSSFTQPEWGAAFAVDPKSQHQKLLPIRVQPCELTGLLAAIIYVDIVGASEQDARLAILGAFSARAKPAHPPAFPGTVEDQLRAVPYPGEDTVTSGGDGHVAADEAEAATGEAGHNGRPARREGGDTSGTAERATVRRFAATESRTELPRLLRATVESIPALAPVIERLHAFIKRRMRRRNPLLRKRRFPKRLTTWKTEKVRLVF